MPNIREINNFYGHNMEHYAVMKNDELFMLQWLGHAVLEHSRIQNNFNLYEMIHARARD